jgi:DNA-binding NtrC family response regulator
MNNKPSILIVDDDESTRTTLEFILRKSNYETESAKNGQEALEKIHGRFFNIALMDIRLPDVLGVELISTIKKRHPDMAVIILTGHASLETAIQALNNGTVAYLTKPLEMNEVLSLIKQILEKQRLMIENSELLQSLQKELAERKRVEKERESLIKDLQDALAKVKTLSGLIPICAACKKIRDDQGYWNHIEEYIRDHSEAEFSHSLCPDCAKELYPTIFQEN